MIVYFMCTYYSQWAHEHVAPRSQSQWDALKFCRAVKSARINGSLSFPWTQGAEMLTQANVGRARFIFGVFIRSSLAKIASPQPVLIPVPSKDGLVAAQSFRSLEMVREAIGHHGNWPVAPVLRFTQALQPANAGGPRGRDLIRPYLQLIANPPPGDIILVDDIMTTGGSLLASYDVLAAACRPPVAAIVCGHTFADSSLSAFGHHERQIDTSPQVMEF